MNAHTPETYLQLKMRQAKELNDFKGIFFAFNIDQLKEGMKKIGYTDIDNLKEKIYSLGAGGYLRKDKSAAFNEMFKRHAQEREQRNKDDKFLFESLVYELRNHEYCVTHDPTSALEALGLDINDVDEKLLKKAMRRAV